MGRDLTVASVQDSYDSKSHSWNAGVDVTIGYGVHVAGDFGIGQGSGSSKWVGEQTSIVGHKEVDIYVEDNTHIKGAIIATDKGGDLTLNTDTLTFERIKDKDTGENWYVGASGGFSIGGVGFDQGKEGDLIKPIDYTNGGSAPYIPDSVEGQYSAHDTRGVLRPTVTEGEIIVRSNPDAATDGSLAGLNRELDRAREITKYEKVNVDVYISPGAIAEVVSGFESIRSNISELSEEVKGLIEKYAGASQKLPPEYQFLGQAGLAAIDNMLANGVSQEDIAKTLANPEFQKLLNDFANLEESYKEFQFRKDLQQEVNGQSDRLVFSCIN